MVKFNNWFLRPIQGFTQSKIEKAKWRVPNVNPMLLLDNTSIRSLSTCEIEEFSLARPDTFCSRCFYPHTHTKNTYTAHTIRKFMTQGRKWQVPNVNPMLLLNNTSIWTLSTCEDDEFCWADAFCSRCLYPHTHTKHIHYIHHLKAYDPRKKKARAKY